jgi:hypothetical protein
MRHSQTQIRAYRHSYSTFPGAQVDVLIRLEIAARLPKSDRKNSGRSWNDRAVVAVQGNFRLIRETQLAPPFPEHETVVKRTCSGTELPYVEEYLPPGPSDALLAFLKAFI